VSEAEFDQIYARILERGIEILTVPYGGWPKERA
jgi:hypothetical protein